RSALAPPQYSASECWSLYLRLRCFSTFFFYCSVDHRDLHSFPTRRSSDLEEVNKLTNNQRAFNFNAGPAALPLEVLEKAKQEMTNFQDSGMSVMELSHRSPTYEAVHNGAIEKLRTLLEIPEDYEVHFVQGSGTKAAYLMTGSWSEKAIAETKLFGEAYEATSSKSSQYRSIPDFSSNHLNGAEAYVHLTSNNTIYGTQWHEFPETGKV